MNAMRRCAVPDPAAFLAGLMPFHVLRATNQTGLIHPAHKTPKEKRVAAKARRRRRELKKERAEEARRRALDPSP